MSAPSPPAPTDERAAPRPPASGPSGAGDAAEPGRRLWPRLLVAGLLLGILAAGLWGRLPSTQYGLPYVYNYEEAQHCTNGASRMFGGDFDPRYYQNPTGFTYMMYA